MRVITICFVLFAAYVALAAAKPQKGSELHILQSSKPRDFYDIQNSVQHRTSRVVKDSELLEMPDLVISQKQSRFLSKISSMRFNTRFVLI